MEDHANSRCRIVDDFALLIVAFAAITAYYTIAALTLIKKLKVMCDG